MDKDLISRQAAIDIMLMAIDDNWEFDYAVERMKELPSAQPEQSSEIQDILEYLDTVLHPIISPDHWNVYSELHDMISMLPSVQPEPISEEYAKAVRNWLVNYQVKCAELQGRYTPYEVLGWIVSDWRKKNGIW